MPQNLGLMRFNRQMLVRVREELGSNSEDELPMEDDRMHGYGGMHVKEFLY